MKRQLLLFYVFFLLVFLLTARLPFFWDKDILYSRMAHWFLDNNFRMLPVDLDPGYPPSLGYLLALGWKITGESMFTAHLLMLPFTLGIIWQTRILLDHWFRGKAVTLAMVLIMADTTLLAQTVMFSTDLVMLFFMLLALNSIHRNRRMLLALAVTGLLFSHMRGLMVAGSLGIYDIYRNAGKKAIISVIPAWLPALALFGAWTVFHYATTGWIGYHDGSPWAPCFERVDFPGFLKNTGILLWRLVDFGKLFLWIVTGISLWLFLKKKLKADDSLRSIVLLITLSLLFSAPSMLFYAMLNGHRYLIPVYYFLAVAVAYVLFVRPETLRFRKAMTILVFTGLLSGSFWIYPDKIAKGWDATLAHLPYHHLRKKMISYIDSRHIPFDQVGSEIPNTYRIDFIEQNGDERLFPVADLQRHPYVFYSNVFNMFTDAQLDELKNEWKVVEEYRWLQVRVTLYGRGK